MGCAGSRPSQLIPSLGNHHHHHPHHMNSPQKGFILFNAKTIEYLQANELEIKEKLKKRCEIKLNKIMPQSTSSKSLLNNAKRTLLFNTSTSTPESVNVEENSATKSDASLPLNNTTLKNDTKMAAIDAAVDYVLKYALNDFDIENFKSSNHLSMKQIRKDIMKKNQSVSSLSKLNNSINTQGTLPSQKTKTATLAKGHDAAMYKQALNAAIDEFCLFVQENFIVINEFDKNSVAENKTEQEEDLDADAEAYKLKEALEVARHNFYKGKISMVCLTKAGGYVVKEVKEQPTCESESAVVLAMKSGKQETIIPKIHVEDAETVENKLKKKNNLEADKVMVQEPKKDVESVNQTEQPETPSDVEKKVDEPEADNSGPIDIKKEIAFSILNVGEVLAKTIDYYSNDPDTQEIKDLIELSAKQSKSQRNTPDVKRKNAQETATKESEAVKESEVVKEPVPIEEPATVEEALDEEAPRSPSSSLVSPSSSSASSLTEADVSSPSKQREKESEKVVLPAEPTTPVAPPELNAYDNNLTTITTNLTPRPEHEIDSNKGSENGEEEEEEEEEETNEFFEAKTDYNIEENAALMKCDTKSASSASDIVSSDEILVEKVSEVNVEVDENAVVFRTGEVSNGVIGKRMSLDEELFYHLEEVDKKVKYMNETCSEDEGGDDDDDLDDENFDYDESVELENGNDERLFHPRTPAKIKSEVRSNRAVDLHEEIKQISNVIQDLVQTINVRNSTNQTEVVNKSSLDNSDEDGSQNSGSGGDCKTKSYHYNRNSNGSHSGNISDRKSIGSNRRSVGNNQSLNSSIPVSVSRQKIAKKSVASNEAEPESVNNSFADNEMIPGTPEAVFNTSVNKSASSQRFRSKLPVKK